MSAVASRGHKPDQTFRSDTQNLARHNSGTPENLDWARLSAEMAANIHVGLAAGECVSPRGKTGRVRRAIPERWRTVALASFATAMLAVLLIGGMVVERPAFAGYADVGAA